MISDIHFPENPLTYLINEYDLLGRKINKFHPICGGKLEIKQVTIISQPATSIK